MTNVTAVPSPHAKDWDVGIFLGGVILSILAVILGLLNVLLVVFGQDTELWSLMGVSQAILAVLLLLGPVVMTFFISLDRENKVLVIVAFVLALAHGLAEVMGIPIPNAGPILTPILYVILGWLYWHVLK